MDLTQRFARLLLCAVIALLLRESALGDAADAVSWPLNVATQDCLASAPSPSSAPHKGDAAHCAKCVHCCIVALDAPPRTTGLPARVGDLLAAEPPQSAPLVALAFSRTHNSRAPPTLC